MLSHKKLSPDLSRTVPMTTDYYYTTVHDAPGDAPDAPGEWDNRTTQGLLLTLTGWFVERDVILRHMTRVTMSVI